MDKKENNKEGNLNKFIKIEYVENDDEETLKPCVGKNRNL